jgi:hypothetical protein
VTEKALWALLKRNLSADVHASRIENRVGTGISDISMCRGGRERWVELKIVKAGKIRFEPSQVVWIPKRLVAGGIVRIFARDKDKLLIYPGAIVHTQNRCMVDLKNVERYILGSWEREPGFYGCWNWPWIEDTLFGDVRVINGIPC